MCPGNQYSHSNLTLFPTDDSKCIYFEFGAPGPELFPVDLVQKASKELNQYYHENVWTTLQYGPSLGSKYFREHLANWLTKEYNDIPVTHEHLCITNGASQSFSNIITLFTNKDTKIFIEDPTYFLAFRILEDHGVKSNQLTSVPVDENGIQTEILESKLHEFLVHDNAYHYHEQDKETDSSIIETTLDGDIPFIQEGRFPFLVYLVPTFSNPTGFTLSLERRHHLIQIARKYNVLVVSDDVYQCFNYNPKTYKPPPRLVALDLETLDHTQNDNTKELQNYKPIKGNVISNGSFSKLFSPGFRLGWTEASPDLTKRFLDCGLLYSGGCPNHFGSSLMNVMIQNGTLSSHFTRIKSILHDRLLSMIDFLKLNLPNDCYLHIPKGGYFIWIKLPTHMDSMKLWRKCQLLRQQQNQHESNDERNSNDDDFDAFVSFTPGNKFSSSGQFNQCLRLSFAFYPKEKLLEGCRRLCVMIQNGD